VRAPIKDSKDDKAIKDPETVLGAVAVLEVFF
jgi:hypothetical protein